MPNNPFDLAHPDIPDTIADAARLAVEFSYQTWTVNMTGIIPKCRGYWTVTMGRLALCHDHKWRYHEKARGTSDAEMIRAQRFVDFEEAVKIVTDYFGREPEHAQYMRSLYAWAFEPEKAS